MVRSCSAASGSPKTYSVQAWRLDVLPLCRPPRQALVSLGNFQHFASRNGIKYFRGNPTSIVGTIVPMRRIVKELLRHCRTSPDRPRTNHSRGKSPFQEHRMNIRLGWPALYVAPQLPLITVRGR